MKSKLFYFFIILIPFRFFGQNDTLPYTFYKDKIVLYSDLGFASAPFSLHCDYNSNVDVLRFKNNFRAVLGLGMSYKWFSLRIGIPLPVYLKPVSNFGKTLPLDIGFDFTIKKFYCDVDFKNYRGYSIKNALEWNDTLTSFHPNDIRPNINTVSFSTNIWYFHNKHFKVSALKGKTGHYNREAKTWYIKSSMSVFGVGNGNQSIAPNELIDTLNTKTGANTLSCFDIGVIPGYAYVNKINNWQFSFFGGVGLALQAKFYAAEEITRGFLGLAPRFDFRVLGGYTVPKFFLFLVTDFDNKSLRFNDLAYRQTFYSIKLVGGIRLDTKEKDTKKNKR